jgi:hypothetical protein
MYMIYDIILQQMFYQLLSYQSRFKQSFIFGLRTGWLNCRFTGFQGIIVFQAVAIQAVDPFQIKSLHLYWIKISIKILI